MIELNNKHIVLVIIIIIVVVFIYNFDVYVIPKNEPLCKPIYITKREISPEIRAELNKTESDVLKEAFGNLSTSGYIESFGNIPGENQSANISIYDIPPKSFSSFTIPSITNKHKLKVIDSVIKILSYIPSNYSESQIKQLVEYFAFIYETSPDLETFYKNVASSTKIKDEPYNSKYSHLILFLFGKFDNDYCSVSGSNGLGEKHDIDVLIGEIIKSNPELSDVLVHLITQSTQSTQSDKTEPESEPKPDYLTEQISKLIDKNSLNPSDIMNVIKKAQQEKKSKQNVILPDGVENSNSNYNPALQETNYLEKQYPTMSNNSTYQPAQTPQSSRSPGSNVYGQGLPIGGNIGKGILKKIKSAKENKCNGAQCSYKCDSSYPNAISYLDSELKPLEGYGSTNNNYASF